MAHDKDIFAMMVKFDERQRTIFNTLHRIEKHLEKKIKFLGIKKIII